MKLREVTDARAWDAWVGAHPDGHPLQLWGWGESKRLNAWVPHRLALVEGDEWRAVAQVLTWRIPRSGRVIAYVPRGPVAKPGSRAAQDLLAGVVDWAREQRALYVRIEPAWTTGALAPGWRRARHHLQLAQTYVIDLSQSEEVLQAAMSHKHRQYIRKSERDGVSIRREQAGELAAMYQMYGQTAQRAGFGIHSREYYETLHLGLGERSYLFYAIYQGEPVAFLWLAVAGRTVYELYGGVTVMGAEVKANYVLKWQAMRQLKAANYEIYDFNGRLNEGVSRFKDGFGPVATDYIGTYDYPLNAVGYRLWEHLWPVVKVVGRRVAGLRRGR